MKMQKVLIQWFRILLEKTGQEILFFYGTQRFIAVFIEKANGLYPEHTSFLRSILM
jgi:hypothetical protein